MEVRVLSAEDVEKLLPMRDCIQVMRDALAALAGGKALVPLRMVMRMPDASGFLGLMPGYIHADGGRDGALGMKAVSVFPATRAAASTPTRARCCYSRLIPGGCRP